MNKQSKTTTDRQEWIDLAWMGWQLTMPSEWRPLRVEGDWQKGAVMIGGTEGLSMQVKWLRPGSRHFNPDEAIETRLRKEEKNSLLPADNCPEAKGFGPTKWLKGNEHDERAVWYGYSADADLVLEVVMKIRDSKTKKWFERKILPSLKAFEPGRKLPISVFGARFMAPPDFKLKLWKLQLGDMTVLLEADAGRSLLLRQIYPAGLALSRRPVERWQRLKPFKEHRKFRSNGDSTPYQIDLNGRKIEAVRRKGRKRLPVPLGFIASRASTSIAVHDPDADRIFIAEYDATKEAPDSVAEQAIAAMGLATQNGNN